MNFLHLLVSTEVLTFSLVISVNNKCVVNYNKIILDVLMVECYPLDGFLKIFLTTSFMSVVLIAHRCLEFDATVIQVSGLVSYSTRLKPQFSTCRKMLVPR